MARVKTNEAEEIRYTYRNKKTGATFSTTCRCAGDDWEEVPEDALKAPSLTMDE